MLSPKENVEKGKTLLELAERCEAATGPNWPLDTDIARAAGYHIPSPPTGGGGLTPTGAMPRYTASVDAALTLVPEGWRMAALCGRNPRFCRLETDDFESVTWGRGSDWITDIVRGQEATGRAATFALAICAAALRSREQAQASEDASTRRSAEQRP